MLVIKKARLIDPLSKRDEVVDILIKDGKILEISREIDKKNCKIIDAEGLVLAPGLVDVHVHFREPGFTEKEDIESGAKAAARGGYTTVVNMANTQPIADNPTTINYILGQASEMDIEVLQVSSITRGLEGKELVDFQEMVDLGVAGFSDDGMALMDPRLVKKALELSKLYRLPVSLHEEDPRLIEDNGINKYSPGLAESSLIARDLVLAIETGGILNIQHISSKMSVELVRWAKEHSKNIHAEVTPHHFTLTEEAVEVYGANAKMNPPLRSVEDLEEIIRGLEDGTIDIIATDHAPHREEDKNKEDIRDAASGIIGLETALSLAITRLHIEEEMSLMDILEKMTINPANLYNIDRGYIEEGQRADLVLFDLEERLIEDDFASKSNNSPFIDWELVGNVRYTISSGKIVHTG